MLTPLLIVGENTPVLFTLARGSYTDLVLTFPLINDDEELNTDWPLNASFPLFLHNVVNHLKRLEE